MRNTTFLATSPRELRDAELETLIECMQEYDRRFWISCGNVSRGEPSLVLCFEGAREWANPAAVLKFKELTNQ
jgi:hypothetical protein